MYTSVNSQGKSPLFSVAAEVRRAIYNYLIPEQLHLFTYRDDVRLSTCVKQKGDDDPDCVPRNPLAHVSRSISDPEDPIYVQRLRSSWGEHWRCEEAALTRDDINFRTVETGWFDQFVLFRVCKRMSMEIAYIMPEVATFHINDPLTLRVLGSQATSHPLTISAVVDGVQSNLRTLHINLRLPLGTYEQLEDVYTSPDFESAPLGITSSVISALMALPTALTQLRNLQNLRLWLDHSDTESWSMVNERAVITSLFQPLCEQGSNLKIDMDLPKLHPKWETSDRHFTPDSAPPPFPIHRRYRQRIYGMHDQTVKHAPDFPYVAHEAFVIQQHEFPSEDPGEMEMYEAWEREVWKRGGDVELELIGHQLVGDHYLG
ncbi:uncharacterized protein EI97DRAFT_505084 [Westerdykella ornata]|uniref:Uncharacterized protein n=1 Tax=Westerdykella ornata TaxID=318751 RepID=A0A6A6J3Z2_WESOR|nr:uncharacterized protein EI97DRAFT_505084 [Westerdykella ornata]KAF2271291.1 hypothetical protein EI97DRAFT_505084 [Westerdykella ornata]